MINLIERKSRFIRNMNAGIYLENLLIAAITTVLGIRLVLKITGYPQIGGSGLHIAHLLFGGFFMLLSIIILLSFLGEAGETLAAILGGIGFGLFIDEVGKFVTSDTNYFFRPAVAIIYITFILIFLVIRIIQAERYSTPQEYLLNALQELKEASRSLGLDEEKRDRILDYLQKSNPRHPLVGPLRNALSEMSLTTAPKVSVFYRLRGFLRHFYRTVAHLKLFQYMILAFFIVDMLIKIGYAMVLIFFIGLKWEQILDTRFLWRFAERVESLSYIGWAQLASSFLAGFFTFLGLLRLTHSRIAAYRMFERSILVSIFITQVFLFYKEQFSALLGLVFNMIILLALRFMIDQEISELQATTVKKYPPS